MNKLLKIASFVMTAALALSALSGCKGADSVTRVADSRTLTAQEYTALNLSGTDALGRTFFSADSENDELYVGMFYFLWLGQHSGEQNGIYDISEITDEGKDLDAFYYTNNADSPLDKYHFWDEPIWGYYQSDDEWVIRKQVEMLTMAGVDYLYFVRPTARCTTV